MANESVTIVQSPNSVTVNQSTNATAAATSNPAAGLGGGGTIQGSLDITQHLDVDGILETDALTINGVPLLETIQDAVGGMVTGNTETGITVNYEDSDGTLDFAVAAQTDHNFTTALKDKLDAVEALADVTDTTNVVAALTGGTNVNLAADGTISSVNTTYSVGDGELTQKNFTTALKDKLDAVEALADVTDTTNVVAALTGGTNVNLAADGTISSVNTTYSVGDGGLTQKNFTTALKDKLDAVEALADVTDTTNVVAALTGGTNVNLAADGTISSVNTTYSVGDGELTQNNFTTALKDKLDAVEALADVTDTTNVVAALTGGTNVNLASRRNDLIDRYEYYLRCRRWWANSKKLHYHA